MRHMQNRLSSGNADFCEEKNHNKKEEWENMMVVVVVVVVGDDDNESNIFCFGIKTVVGLNMFVSLFSKIFPKN